MLVEYIFIVSVILALLLAAYAAWSDLKSLTIPNWISLGICLLFPVAVVFSPQEINWLWSVAVFTGVLCVGFCLFAIGALGGGDIKLLAALSLWAGLSGIFPFLLTTVLAGGGLVIIIVISHALKRTSIESGFLINLRNAIRADLSVPYGVAIALGSITIFYHYALLSNLIK